MVALLIAILAVVAGGGGCEFIVGDTVPAFECKPGADPCPDGKVCDPATMSCVAPCSSASCAARGGVCDSMSLLCVDADGSVNPVPDATIDGASGDAPGVADAASEAGNGDAGDEMSQETGDASTTDSTSCRGLTCACAGPSACDSGVCADKLTVGSGLYAKTMMSFCTKPCCTSNDCDANTVCYSTAAGGALCVLPEWLGRSTQLGNKIGGAACTAGSECRSGLCSGNMCGDTCCSTAGTSTQCAAGTTCGFGSFPGVVSFDTGVVAYCAPGGNGAGGSQCSYPTDCQSGFCDGRNGVCRDACRNSGQCGAGLACVYQRYRTPPVVIAACVPQVGGNTPTGGTCSVDSDCVTNFCAATTSDPSVLKCTDVCFADSDCTVAGWRCRPQYVTVGNNGMTSVLCCGM